MGLICVYTANHRNRSHLPSNTSIALGIARVPACAEEIVSINRCVLTNCRDNQVQGRGIAIRIRVFEHFGCCFGAPVTSICLWGSSPPCKTGISRRSVYQSQTSREQARGEGNCGRSNDRGKEACECVGSRARGFESPKLMGGSCSSTLNRSALTRMPWWCG
jgi:hypothetical protein